MIMWASSPINPLSSICLPICLLLVLSGETWLIGPQIWQASNFGTVMCHVMLPHKHSWKQQTNLVQETKTITHCTADHYMVSTHRQFLLSVQDSDKRAASMQTQWTIELKKNRKQEAPENLRIGNPREKTHWEIFLNSWPQNISSNLTTAEKNSFTKK